MKVNEEKYYLSFGYFGRHRNDTSKKCPTYVIKGIAPPMPLFGVLVMLDIRILAEYQKRGSVVNPYMVCKLFLFKFVRTCKVFYFLD
jgi:hypothetical protein